MELRVLRYFVAVAEEGSVTAAAERCQVAQPSLSRQLHALERELGVRLFDRNQRRLTLSSAGRRFLPIAQDLVVRADLARDAARALRDGSLSAVVISSPGTTLTDIVAPFLATWDANDPLPEVWESEPGEHYRPLRHGADLAIGSTPPPPEFSSARVARLPVWAHVPPQHPWSEREFVSLPDLTTERLLVLGPRQHARVALEAALTKADIGVQRLSEFHTPEVAMAVAAAGRGAAVLSDDPRYGLVPKPIDDEDPLHITLYAAWSPEHHAAATLTTLTDRLTAFCLGHDAQHR